ncbi:MAG: cell division protein FtsQ/DivIB [Peptococcaceae bacterium]
MNVTHLNKYRKKKRQPNRNFKIPTPVIYFLLTAVGLYFFIHSPFFAIKDIKVVGNRLLETEKIVNLSQVKTGQNLMELDKKDIGEKVAVHPFVKEVEIKRRLPNTLEIKIIERDPVGLVVCSDGFIQVSEEGHFLALVNDIGEYSLPVISGISLDQLPGPGQIINNPGLQMALQIVKNCQRSLLKNIAEINIANKKHILAYTLTGIEIRLGSFAGVTERLTGLNEILQDFNEKNILEKNIEYIDLRFTGPPIIKTKK